MKKVLIIVGARPNFIKITQFEKEFAKYAKQIDYKLLHTGQHFDKKMSDIFFRQLNIKLPDYYLKVKETNAEKQIAEIIVRLEKVLKKWTPDLVMVVGDVNSTLAGALAANKSGIRIAHLESGLRSFDKSMPEEMNRILTDEISELFFITEESAKTNLLKEGKNTDKIYFTGNTMIDSLVAFQQQIDTNKILKELKLQEKTYVLTTMHRPATVDVIENARKLMNIIQLVTKKYQVVFPMHPRTLKRLKAFDLLNELKKDKQLLIIEPQDYLSFQKLMKSSKFVLTDSGGIQEETTYLQIPCLTMRPNTERPVTVQSGTNEIIDFNLQKLAQKMDEIATGNYKKGSIPPMWDGKATSRVVKIIADLLIK